MRATSLFFMAALLFVLATAAGAPQPFRVPVHSRAELRSAATEAATGIRRLHELKAAVEAGSSVDAALNGTFLPIAKGYYVPKYTVGPVTAGTPPQTFYLIPDSGSNYVALPSAVSIPSNFHQGNQYEPSASSSYKDDNIDIALVYGGGGLYGTGSYDTFTVAGSGPIPNQGFSAVHEITGNGFIAPGQYWEGIWGLCFQGLYHNSSNPFGAPGYYKTLADNLWESGAMATNSIGAYFSNELGDATGELMFGGVNPDHYSGSITYVDVLRMYPTRPNPADQYGYWLMNVDEVQIDGRSLGVCTKNSCHGFVDTGGPILNVPLLVAEHAIPYLHVNPNCSDVEKNPTFTFVLSGHSFDIGPEHYVFKLPKPDGSYYCELAVGASSNSPSNFMFQFGDPWVRKYYTHFIMGDGETGMDPQIGFAPAHA